MKVRYLLIIAVTSAAILLAMSGFKQAQAYNLVSILGSQKITITSDAGADTGSTRADSATATSKG